MRALWSGETVTHRGLVVVEDAKLYTLPDRAPKIIGAAITPETAEWVGGWADGLITIVQPKDTLSEVVQAFRRGGGEGKPMFLQVQLSYAEDKETARQGAYEQWGANIFSSPVLSDLTMPGQFESISEFVRPEDLDGHIRISADVHQHIAWLQSDIELGFDHLYLHNVNRDQHRFIEVFGDRVLPELRSS